MHTIQYVALSWTSFVIETKFSVELGFFMGYNVQEMSIFGFSNVSFDSTYFFQRKRNGIINFFFKSRTENEKEKKDFYHTNFPPSSK